MIVVVHHRRHGELANVALALGGLAFVPCARQHRQQQTCEQGDDGDDDEQLDQGKGMRRASGTSALWLESHSHLVRNHKQKAC